MNTTPTPSPGPWASLGRVRRLFGGAGVARWELAAYGGILALAAAMRLWDLGSRAIHHDESLHAFYAWNLYSGNGFQHNPMMHGPFQMEATAAAFFLFGDSDFTARLLYALAGTALVALPFFFRSRLGRLGAVLVSVLLAFSPAMLYFSRFARNDILMAVWTLGLVISMWRYLDEGKSRYLYIGSALLALAFATKETAYLVTATLGLYLAVVVVARNWGGISSGTTTGQMSPPAAIARIVRGAWTSARRGRLSEASRPAAFLLLLVTLTLPLWSALASVVQDTPLLGWSGLVLASPVGAPGPIGAPVRGGLVVAALVVAALMWISASVGDKWNRAAWWRCAVIFSVIWVLLFTTFLTNMVGTGSGIWQSLGYWLVQQGEARGSQPWYYYFVITSVYEFLPLLFALVAGVYYSRRDDAFGHFLVFWAATTFVLYTIASEKMPWLLVNVTMPLIVLSGRFLGEVIEGIRWRSLVPERSARDLASLVAIPLAAVLLALSVRAGWHATYRNGDIPVEMIVYTQTSPDIVGVLRQVERFGAASGEGTGVSLTVDQASGFSWPWAWYLRDYTKVGYASYDGAPPQNAPDSSVVLVHSNNQPKADPVLAGKYDKGIRIKHRWWFPESYKGMTLGKFIRALADPGAWNRALDYFLYRELGTPLGSEDAYVYFSRDFPPEFTPIE